MKKLTQTAMENGNEIKSLLKDPQATSLTKALGIDAQGMTRLRAYNGDCALLRWLQREKELKTPLSEEIILWFWQQGISVENLQFIQDRMSYPQIRHYLCRQMKASGDHVHTVINTWADYLSMAKRLGLDTQDKIIYRARLLNQRHDELVIRCHLEDKKEEAARIAEKHPAVNQICRSIRDKFAYANEMYAVVVPSGVLDILVDGRALNHCVGASDRYWDRIEQHETYILFVRKTSALDTPYYTLEVEPDGTVRQRRTGFNRSGDDIEAVTEFLREWQQVVAKRLTVEDRNKASVSRVLREQEFEQMRQNNTRINIGDLAGHRLVDVLIADLMENAA